MSPELVYDDSCRFCVRCARLLDIWDRAGRVCKLPFQNPRVQMAHPELASCSTLVAIRFYDGGGHSFAGAAALREAVRLLPFGTPVALLMSLPGLSKLAERAYAWVARHRLR
ncbi:MAG: DUF393 domain-containing protein [Candidatus Riflebacteria bacterium]|nr:DUF393 domain-containing protein [Candidatus Riflebacteria bacterium]